MNFNNLSLKQKLLGSFSFVLLVLLIIMGILFNSQYKLGDIQHEGAERFKDSGRISEIVNEVSSVYAVAADGVINGNLDETKKDLLELKAKKEAGIKDVLRIADTEQEKKNAAEFEKRYNHYIDIFESKLLPELEKKAGLSDQVRAIDGELDAARDHALETLAALYKDISEESHKADLEFEKIFEAGIRFSAIISFAGVVAAIALLLYVLANITKDLRAIVSALRESGVEVSSAASEIAATSEELSQATSEQSSSLQETSSSIEEISQMINSNTENARQSSAYSEKSLGVAEKGKDVVTQMIGAIGNINESNAFIVKQIDESNREIENIIQIINEIGNKTKVINDIVFQTKLLSFNASVEAARAGEQGKGFAVVAEEVGNLASMSGAAALEITKMLDESTKTVERIIRESKEKIGRLVGESKDKVEAGTRVANECSEVLGEIVEAVALVSTMINEISNASQEQAQGVHEITKAISQLDNVTQQNSAATAQAANAASSLSVEADKLNNQVVGLVSIIDGKDSTNKKIIA